MLKDLFGKTQNEKKKNIIRIIYLTVAVILMISVALAIALAVGSTKSDIPENNGEDTTQVTEKVVKYSFADTQKGTLIVVNKNNEFNFEANESALVSISAQNYSLKYDNMRANKTALSALNKMLGDFYNQATDKDTAKKLTICSAYRSFEEQKGFSFPQGRSDFHTGMLFELAIDSAGNSITGIEAFKWIYENAQNYGFVQRYPYEKSAETGVNNLDNAFRYVGVPHAKYMKEHNLCLEEYVALIQTATEPIVSDGYKITYVKANTEGQTEITVSSNNYIVSGDNMGGFIVATK